MIGWYPFGWFQQNKALPNVLPYHVYPAQCVRILFHHLYPHTTLTLSPLAYLTLHLNSPPLSSLHCRCLQLLYCICETVGGWRVHWWLLHGRARTDALHHIRSASSTAARCSCVYVCVYVWVCLSSEFMYVFTYVHVNMYVVVCVLVRVCVCMCDVWDMRWENLIWYDSWALNSRPVPILSFISI